MWASSSLSVFLLIIPKFLFDYGEIEVDHISPQITEAHLLKFHLKMTAREMMSFMTLFPFMVGDLVPEDDHVWLFLLNFIEIIDILMLNEIPHDLAERLKILIKQHHRDYVRFFNDTLKPKHHFMLHYYEIILQSGPPRFYWTFRFEAKHKDFKIYARSITSRKNICVSIGIKFQLTFANYLLENKKPIYTMEPTHMIQTNYEELILGFCDRNNINSDNFRCYSKCIYYSKKFKRNNFICQYLDPIFSENVFIYQILEIVLFHGCDSVHLICKRVKVKKYHKHFAAYVVDIV